MDHLTSRMAQEIIDELRKTISNDIHITDRHGRVIASSKVQKIGRLNLSAMASLNTRNISRIWEDTDTQVAGVSVPIIHNSAIIGVLCVDGKVQEIDPIILLLKTSVEMLIHQMAMLDSDVKLRRMREQYLREWISHPGDYDKNFVDRGLELRKDIQIPRVAAVMKDLAPFADIDSLLSEILERNDGFVTHWDGMHVLLIADNPKLNGKLQQIVCSGIGEKIGISQPLCHAQTAVHQAQRALLIGDLFLGSESIVSYPDVRLIDAVSTQTYTDEMRRVIRLLDEHGRGANLTETLFTYVFLNGNIQKTTEALFIHRNSLNYRFQRIYEISGYHPEQLQDLIFLYSALICSRISAASH